MKFDIYQIITDRIIALLESGTIPWRKPWKESQPPQNLVSRKPYRGVNVFLLNSSKFASPYWLSFKQVQAIGGAVRKGEHACPVVFWKLREVENEKSQSNEKKRVPLLRYYNVFNVEQCDNIKPSLAPKKIEREFQPLERCENVVLKMPQRPEIIHGAYRASYSPSEDKVLIPHGAMFDSRESYYNTLFHELTHATGHASRLGRKGIIESNRFGSDHYSHEELVAEMGAAFLCGHCGIEDRTLGSSASYLQAWLERLKNDRKLIILAAAQAQRACDFVRDFEFKAEGGDDAATA